MKKVIIFAQKDPILTYRILNNLINKFTDLEFYIKLDNVNIKRKFKIILCLLLFSKFKELFSLLKFQNLSSKFKLVNSINNEKFDFGIVFNYQKKNTN